MDPVGNFGEGPKKIAMSFKALGLQDVSCVLYPNDRHELLNELNRQDVYEDLHGWLDARMRAAQQEKGKR